MTESRLSRAGLTKLEELAEGRRSSLLWVAWQNGAKQSADQEDAVQDAWVTLLQKQSQVVYPLGFLRACIRFQAMSPRMVRGGRYEHVPLLITLPNGWEEPRQELVAEEGSSLLWLDVEKIIRTRLTPRQQQCIALFAMGYPSLEVGKKLGISQQRANEVIMRAQKIIKEAMLED